MIVGIYHHGYHYIRFYSDGSFVSGLVRAENPHTESLKKISGWFGKEAAGMYKGKYKMKGKSVSFSDKNAFGDRMIDYSGTVTPKGLELESLNHNNGRREKRTYQKANW